MEKLWAILFDNPFTIAFWLLALAAQVSGYIRGVIGVVLALLGTVVLAIAIWSYSPALSIAATVATVFFVLHASRLPWVMRATSWIWAQLGYMNGQWSWQLQKPWVRSPDARRPLTPAPMEKALPATPWGNGRPTIQATFDPNARPILPEIRRQLSSYQVDLKLAATKPILDLLRSDMQRLVGDGRSMRETAWAVFQNRERNASYQVIMETYRTDARYRMAALENMLNKAAEYPDVVEAAKHVHSNGLETKTGDFMRRFAVLIQHAKPDIPSQHFMELMEPANSRLNEEIDALNSALTKARNALVEIMKGLSK